MAMDFESPKHHSSVTRELAVPESGLSRVLADWSGVGSLYQAISGITGDDPFDRDWSPEDVERRAMRVLLEECAPLISQWPQTLRAWLDQLPITSTRHRFWSDRVVPRVDWPKTRRKGWPPSSLAIKRRHKTSDQTPLVVLAWTIDELMISIVMAQQLMGSSIGSQSAFISIVPQLETASELRETLLDVDDPGIPTAEDFAAVAAMGRPWTSIVGVGRVFASRYRRDGVAKLARRLIRPDGFPDRLFQLAVLGIVLEAAESAGCYVVSRRPIGDMTSAPVYQLVDEQGRQWDVWCEADRCWAHYGVTDHHFELSQALANLGGKPFQRRHLRPDIVLAQPMERALVIECKFPYSSADPGYVASGLSQSYFYAAQLQQGFARSDALVVGPSELVQSVAVSSVQGVQIGLASPGLLRHGVSELVRS